MIRLFIAWLIFLFLANPHVQSQGFSGAWRISTSIAAQEQDRRMYGWPTGSAKEIIAMEEHRLNWQYSVGLHKAFLHREDFTLELGLRYDLEINRFSRPVDHSYFFPGPIYSSVLYLLNDYQVHQLTMPLSLRVRLCQLGKQAYLFVGGDLLPALAFARRISIGNNRQVPIRWEVRPYSLEVNPGLGYRRQRLELMLSYRAFHRRVWDQAIFGNDVFRPASGPPTQFDQFNPHKIWLSVSYDLAGVSQSNTNASIKSQR
ncbi:MAG: hypothetical protein AAF804_11810 [Bacteroidota bacterium]